MNKRMKTVLRYEKDYYKKLASRFIGVNQRFDKKPYLMLAANGICALIYMIARGVAMDNEDEGIVYFLTIIWGLSVLLGVVYTISAILKKTKKTLPLALTAVFIVFLLLWNMIIVSMAIRDLEDMTEWIPLLVFTGLSCGWYLYMILKLRKEIRGESVKQIKVPMWLIIVVLITMAPTLTCLGRRNLGDLIPENVFVWYMAYLIFLINVVTARFVLDLIMFCKGRVSGWI